VLTVRLSQAEGQQVTQYHWYYESDAPRYSGASMMIVVHSDISTKHEPISRIDMSCAVNRQLHSPAA
jgi:hypothetical protein